MTAEAPNQTSGQKTPEVELLEQFLLATLEQHDGLCLDNETERADLAAALALALIDAAGDGPTDHSTLPVALALAKAPQTSGGSVSGPLAE